MEETRRILDLTQRAFAGDAWHGPALTKVVLGVDAELAARRPIPGAHSIWEIIRHVGAWQEIVGRRLAGEPARQVPAEEDWPPVDGADPRAWQEALADLDRGHRELLRILTELPAERLDDTVAGADYTLYTLAHGLIHHHLYHAGQVALLKRALGVAAV